MLTRIRLRRSLEVVSYMIANKKKIGTYAEVWSVTHKITKNVRAVKIVKKSLARKNSKLPEMLHSEFESLTKIVISSMHLF